MKEEKEVKKASADKTYDIEIESIVYEYFVNIGVCVHPFHTQHFVWDITTAFKNNSCSSTI